MTEPILNSTAEQLTGFVDRIEKLNEEIKEIQEDRKQIFQQAAGVGINVKALRRVIRERAMDREELDEFDALVDQYWGTLGRR